MPTSSRMTYPPGSVRPSSGSSESTATFPIGKPHDGQNLCSSLHSFPHCGQERIRRAPEAITAISSPECERQHDGGASSSVQNSAEGQKTAYHSIRGSSADR